MWAITGSGNGLTHCPLGDMAVISNCIEYHWTLELAVSEITLRWMEEMSHSENAAALLSQMRFQNADAISKCRCDFKTQMRFQNADAISKCRCDFKTQMRFQNADAISKRRCVYKTPGYLYCECNRSSTYLGDAYHNKLYAGELRI